MNDDALSQTDTFIKKQPKLKKRHFRAGHKKKEITRNRSEVQILESIEEQNHEKDDNDQLEEDEESKH